MRTTTPDELSDVLLVDDNPGDVLLIQEAFRQIEAACRVTVARDGASALLLLRERCSPAGAPRPRLILLDINLPKISGHELLVELKRETNLRQIPVVVLTSSQAERDRLKSHELQANAHVQKPDDPREYVEILRAIDRLWLNTPLKTTSDWKSS